MGAVTLFASLAQSVLYLRQATPEASPKAISGRTSYLQVRLAFHLYPQVIRAVFNRHRYGPPPRDYRGFTLPMGSSPGFGSTAGNWSALADSLSLRLRLCALTSLPTVTRRFILQKARRHPAPASPCGSAEAWAPTACRHAVSGSISLPSRGAFHLSLTVLVRYRSKAVLSLRRWSSRIPTGFHVPRGTWVARSKSPAPFADRAFTFCGAPFQAPSASTRVFLLSGGSTAPPSTPPQPRRHNAGRLSHDDGLGSSHFARRYFGSRVFFPLLGVLRCFSSPAYPPRLIFNLGPGFPIMTSGGFPHSGASGSRPACGSPELFAACRALLRPLPPRHPPRALSSLTCPRSHRAR